MQWHVARSGRTFGPFSADQLRQMVATGRVQATDLISSSGGAWVPASSLNWLFPELPPAEPVRAVAIGRDGRPLVIEATSKRWKLFQLVGGAMMVGGCTTAVAGQRHTDTGFAIFVGATVFALAGCALWLVGRICAWWNHG